MHRIKRPLKYLAVCLALWLVFASSVTVYGENAVVTDLQPQTTYDCKSAILMEADTGRILFEQNPDEALPPASVTKVMTLLLVMEAIEKGQIRFDDTVTASAHACSMGGSQIFLEEGEEMTVEDMVKSVVIASANDAAVALAEHISGSEAAFVSAMNVRANELGMKNTHFENTNGLDDTVSEHVTSARDIAIMSRALIQYPQITEYSSIWMDTIRNGKFGLTNTNRLIRFYRGATGLKTGSTAKAGFCISATAERDGMTLICVIMGASTRDIRNASATALLDWGFANYTKYACVGESIGPIVVRGGVETDMMASVGDFSAIVEKGTQKSVERIVDIPQYLIAPIQKGQTIGEVIFRSNGVELGRCKIVAVNTVEKIDFWGVFIEILKSMVCF